MKFQVAALLLLALATEAQQQQIRRKQGKRRSLQLCLGIFRDCDDLEEDSDTSDPTTDDAVGGGTGSTFLDDINFPCLGLLRDCDESDSKVDIDEADCETGGIFGGKPLFGNCGVVNTLLDDAFNTTRFTEGDDTIFNTTLDEIFADDEDGPFGLGLLPEGGLLWRVFNRDEDTTILEAIFDNYRRSTNAFSSGFLEEWGLSANAIDTVCDATEAQPTCLDLSGDEGFWVCRTLTDPFTSESSSKSICIGEGFFLDGNDQCGCCGDSCPAPCGCSCDNNGSDGVLMAVGLDEDQNELPSVCVSPEYAASVTSRFERFACLETCPE